MSVMIIGIIRQTDLLQRLPQYALVQLRIPNRALGDRATSAPSRNVREITVSSFVGSLLVRESYSLLLLYFRGPDESSVGSQREP